MNEIELIFFRKVYLISLPLLQRLNCALHGELLPKIKIKINKEEEEECGFQIVSSKSLLFNFISN